jgi:hypothetical protein
MNPPDQPDLAPTQADLIVRKRGEIRDHALYDFARTLERELAAAQQEAAHYMSIAQKATDELIFFRADNLKAHQMTCAAGLERDSLRAEVERWKTVAAEMSQEREHNANEASRLRAEVERLKIIEEKFRQSPMWDVLAIVQTRNNWQACAEKAEAALAFIAENGGTTHETECGTISCNGSWCAEQARAAIDAAMKGTPTL